MNMTVDDIRRHNARNNCKLCKQSFTTVVKVRDHCHHCRATEQTFEHWNVEFKTELVWFDVSGFQNSEEERFQIFSAQYVVCFSFLIVYIICYKK